MARNSVHIDAPPARVFEVLSDPYCYPRWVVGASEVRESDPRFPAAGTRFHHRVGPGPLKVSDHTEVIDVDPPRRIALRAKARPLGTARIDLELSPVDGGTTLVMVERPADLLTKLAAGNPLADGLLRVRNAEALRRLKRLVETRR